MAVEDGIRIIRLRVIRRKAYRCTIPEMITYILSSCFAVRRIKRIAAPDISLVFLGIPSGPAAVLMRLLYRIPYVLYTRGQDIPGFLDEQIGLYHRVTKPFTRWMWKNSARVIALTSQMESLIKKTMPELATDVIPNGVDELAFSPRPDSPGDKLRFLFAGRVVYQKGLVYLIRACRLVVGKGLKNFKLFIVGNGPDRPALAREIRAGNLEDYIVLQDWMAKESMADLYRNVDVFVLPALYEGMSNAVLEAMASGLAVIATNVSGNEELVSHGVNGFLVAPKDANALAAAIEKLLIEPGLTPRMGMQSRRMIEKSYDWDSATDKLYSLLSRCVQGPAHT